jgi:hypothetical protein
MNAIRLDPSDRLNPPAGAGFQRGHPILPLAGLVTSPSFNSARQTPLPKIRKEFNDLQNCGVPFHHNAMWFISRFAGFASIFIYDQAASNQI